MKNRILSVLLVFMLLMSTANAEFGMSREDLYKLGIEALFSADENGLSSAVSFFKRAGNYRFAQLYAIYAEILQKISRASEDSTEWEEGSKLLEEALISLSVLKEKREFLDDLPKNYFPSCEDIEKYVKALKLERTGEIEKAIDIYRKLSVLDSTIRAIALEQSRKEKRYEEAIQLFNKGEYIKAGRAFEELKDYLDSETMKEKSFARHTHEWDKATCEKPKTCKICGKTEGAPSGHSWIDATCMSAKKCRNCGTTEGSPSGHSWVAATCTSAKRCSVCEKTEGRAKGHSWMAATCTSAKKCRNCGTTEGSPSGHSWVAATCTSARRCSACGKTEGSAKGHSWERATCTSARRCSVCGKTDGSPSGHNWESATCTSARRCSVCGKTEGSALGHNWEGATCTSARYCIRCGRTEGSALGHDYSEATVYNPATCRRCGKTTGTALKGKYRPQYVGTKYSAADLGVVYVANTYGSSYYNKKGRSYPYSQAFDNDRNTCWVDGSEGARISDYIGCEWRLSGGYQSDYAAYGFCIYNGMQYKGSESYNRNSRVKNITVTINGYSYSYTVMDTMSRQEFTFGGDAILAKNGSFDVKISVNSVYTDGDGTAYDIAIGDVQLMLIAVN